MVVDPHSTMGPRCFCMGCCLLFSVLCSGPAQNSTMLAVGLPGCHGDAHPQSKIQAISAHTSRAVYAPCGCSFGLLLQRRGLIGDRPHQPQPSVIEKTTPPSFFRQQQRSSAANSNERGRLARSAFLAFCPSASHSRCSARSGCLADCHDGRCDY